MKKKPKLPLVYALCALAVIVVYGALIMDVMMAEPVQAPEQTLCVEGTFLQADNTCLPPNSTRGNK